MKIIVSPSKTQNDRSIVSQPIKLPRKQELTYNLFHTMKSIDKESLADLMKVKGELLNETFALYQGFDPTNPMLHAIDCYEGVVFQEIKTVSYNEQQISYMNNHLAILSAMYGVLEPDTSIWPYRLDMTVKPAGINLYRYWKETVEEYFSKEDRIVNLASDEFGKMVKPFENRMLHLHFYEKKKEGIRKVASFNAKKARGLVAHFIISNRMENVSMIKEFAEEGYSFDKQLSDSRNYYFCSKTES